MRFFLAIAALFLIFTDVDGKAAPASGAGNMGTACWPICARSAVKLSIPGETFPQKGVVFAFGSFLSSGASWQIVDFDRHTVTAIDTNLDRSAKMLTVQSKKSVSVSEVALGAIVALADDLWNPKTPAAADPKPPEICTDISNDLILFDGERALHYLSLCPPGGVAGDMERWIKVQLSNSSTP